MSVSKNILHRLQQFTKDLESAEPLSNKYRLRKIIRREDGAIEVTESYRGKVTKKVIEDENDYTRPDC